MKMPIKWHEECLANATIYHSMLEQQAAIATRRAIESASGISRYAAQIEEAKKRGLEEFDRERLMVKRKKK